MKKQEAITAQMDEIIFENRNKTYGAYILRKMYNKHLSRALLLAIAIMFAGLAYPLVSSYYSHTKARHIADGVIVDVFTMPNPNDRITPPILPPPPADPIPREKFIAPVVTIGEVKDEDGLPMQDELNQSAVNIPVDMTIEKAVEKPAIVIIEDPETTPPVISVEEMPSFPGGDQERQKFLSGNIVYPQQAAEIGIQGTVYVQFIVNSKGNITDVKILRGIGGGCDEEAIRVIKMMPQWYPGKQNGKAVRVLFNMAVYFKLES